MSDIEKYLITDLPGEHSGYISHGAGPAWFARAEDKYMWQIDDEASIQLTGFAPDWATAHTGLTAAAVWIADYASDLYDKL